MGALLVRLGGVKVGVLECFGDESQEFTFCDEYCSALIGARPVLGQIFEDRFPHPISVGGPICWFAHLLPQGVMRRWRSRLLGLDEDDTFGLLQQLGSNMPGAIVLAPTEPILRTQFTEPNARIESPASDVSPFRFSLAGAQWKLSARSSGRGLTTGAKAQGTEYIAKFHAPEYPDLPQCEFATMNWARAAGLSIPAFTLRNVADFDQIPEEMPTGDGTVFVIERFDREDGERIHIEDFGQILDRPPGDAQYHGSYEEIASVIRWIAPESTTDFLKSIVFNVICGNGDAHLKNFSVIYPDGRNALLTPGYDIVSTFLFFPPGKEQLALSLNANRQFRSIGLHCFSQLFELLGMANDTGEGMVKDFADATVSAWCQSEVQSGFTSKQIDRISGHLYALPLLNDLRLP
ncbi:MAG: type II toxin-antitoxin system HipA family toxin [Planctomycetota bacterium]